MRLTEWFSAKTLLIGGVMLAILMVFIEGFQDPDFWWHLRVGRRIAENGKPPSNDLVPFTVPDHVRTDHESLTEHPTRPTSPSAGHAGRGVSAGRGRAGRERACFRCRFRAPRSCPGGGDLA